MNLRQGTPARDPEIGLISSGSGIRESLSRPGIGDGSHSNSGGRSLLSLPPLGTRAICRLAKYEKKERARELRFPTPCSQAQ